MNKYVRETLFGVALKYCRLRLLPFNELGYEETCEYGLRRSRLHDSISRILDVDRGLVEKAFTESAEPFGFRTIDGIVVDASCKIDSSEFTDIYDSFCKRLDALTELNDKERHPDALFEEDLDKMDFGDLAPMPTMESNEQPIDESRIVCEEWIDENGNKCNRFKYAD